MLMFRPVLRQVLLASCCSLALVGCAGMPSSGPTSMQVQEQASSTDTMNFGFVEVTPAVAALNEARGNESLFKRFGDYRAAPGLTIGPGDVISVALWEAPPGSLFSPSGTDRGGGSARGNQIPDQVVGRDGSITVPFAGRIQVSGRTPNAVQDAIVERLRGKAVEPQALVTVTKSISNAVAVTGEVTSGARVPISPRGDRLMDIIASAGGVRAPVHESYVRVTRGNGSASVPLSIILTRPQENIFVRPGDVVTVVRDPQSFTVIGAAGRNQTVQFDAQGISFAEALAKSGGVLDYRADPQGVFLLRFEPESIARKLLPPENPLLQQGGMIPIVYRFNMLEASQIFLAQRFPMRNRDILYVSNAPMAELQKMLQIVQSVTSPVVTGVGIAAATR